MLLGKYERVDGTVDAVPLHAEAKVTADMATLDATRLVPMLVSVSALSEALVVDPPK
jgi:hypothetical protein